MPVSTSAVKVNPLTGALIDPIAATFASANGIALLTDLTSFFDYKGGQDCSLNPNYPPASKGDVYSVTVSGGRIGGASGVVVAIGDTFLATADNAGGTQAAVGSSWLVMQANIDLSNIAITGGTITGTTISGNTINSGSGVLTLSTFTLTVAGTASISGTNTGDQTSVTGNAGTATALATARNIFNISFNGTANVAGDATNTGHFASIPGTGAAGHFVTENGTAPTLIAGRSAWYSDGSGVPSFKNGTGTAVTLVRSSDIGVSVQAYDADLTTWAGITPGANVGTFLATPSGANLASALTTAIPETKGGTNQTTYTTGDLLYASAANTLSKLADVATGNALISGGVGAIPAWGKIALTTHVSGTLPEANGGTAFTSLVKFHAYKTADQTTTGGSYEQVTFPSEEYDTGSNFASNAFTAPVAGKYIFGASLYCATASRIMNVALYKNGTQIKRLAASGGTLGGDMMGGTVTMSLAANDVITIYSYTDSATTLTGAQTIAYFWGALLAGS